MLETLKEEVCRANISLKKHGVVLFTWGNVSARDPETGLVVIKPSGVEYDSMNASDMVVVDENGKCVEGKMNPSVDLPTHLVLYRAFPTVFGIVHTHSSHATAWAQAGRSIPCYGTTHADDFYGAVPCTRALTDEEIRDEYERNTGNVIAETVADRDPLEVPGILVKNHGVFTWGKNADSAVHHAVVLEEIAKTAAETERINHSAEPVSQALLDRHFLRKHGKNASYGQKK